MSDPRVRRIDARYATPEVAEYRQRVAAGGPAPAPGVDVGADADELVRLCRFRNRPAILRNSLRFGRGLLALRASDLDGDGNNELLVVDSDRTIHTLRYQGEREGGWGPAWHAGSHRYRGRMLGLSFTGFGVFHRQEAILTSVEDHPDGVNYHELKLTCDGAQWDVAELVHRRAPGAEGQLLLIGDSGEPGRVPVLRSRDGKLLCDVLDDRQAVRRAAARAAGAPPRQPLAELLQDVSTLVLCDDELVVAFASGGLLRITREGRLRPLLFPQWRFTCLAFAPRALLGPSGPDGGLLCGGTSFGYVFAIDLRRGAVLWRMDAGFLFSCMALADVESGGRVDLLLGGMDGGLRIYELTDSAALEARCRERYAALEAASAEPDEAGGVPTLNDQADALLQERAPPGHEAHPQVQLYLLSRILESPGPAHAASLKLVRWFTLGQPGWHMLPEGAQREAVSLLERFLLSHLPLMPTPFSDSRSTMTGPVPLFSPEELQDPQVGLQLSGTILSELADIYLAAPRLVRRQIDRISRRLMGQLVPGLGGDEANLGGQLQRLLNVRGLRSREYASTLAHEAEAALRRFESLPENLRPPQGGGSDVFMRVLRAIGLLEEARQDRFSMEYERLDLSHAVFEPPHSGAALLGARSSLSEGSALPPGGGGPSWVAGIGRNGMLRIERVPLPAPAAPGAGGPGTGTGTRPGAAQEIYLAGTIRFLEARRFLLSPEEGVVPALVAGLEEAQGTRLLLFSLGKGGATLRSEALVPAGAEPVGFDLLPDPAAAALTWPAAAATAAEHAEHAGPAGHAGHAGAADAASRRGAGRPEDDDGTPTLPGLTPGVGARGPSLAEVLVLRVPPGEARGLARVLAIDAPGGHLRVREDLLSPDLHCVTANRAASLHVTAARLTWRGRPGSGSGPGPGAEGAGLQLSVPAGIYGLPSPHRCCALADDGRTMAVGTASGVVQVFAVTGSSLMLAAQHQLPKGVSALCFVPAAVYGVPALAVGAEDEQVYIFAVDEPHSGLSLARLAVGGAPNRIVCGPHPDAAGGGGHRLAMTLRGGVAAAWDAPQNPGDPEAISHLLELAVRAAGSRRAALGAALLGPSPHARAVAMRAILRDTRQGRWDGDHAGGGAGAVLELIAGLLGLAGEAGWQPRPERHHIVLSELCEELAPLALGPPFAADLVDEGGALPDPHDVRLARALLERLVQQCDEPLSIRADLLAIIERHMQPAHVSELLGWLPPLILQDARSATWPFSLDSVGALFLQHLRRLDRAHIFDEAEPEFFRNVATVLEATAPSQPSRLLLTKVALLLRSALIWEPAYWAGNLGRARLYLPHAAIEALCQPAIIPDPEARQFLLGVSRRWGPRLPMIGVEDGEEASLGGAGEDAELGWWLEVALDSGFDELYYERLADELTRFTRPAVPGETDPDAWELADTVQAVLRLFDVGNLMELLASLQPLSAQRCLEAIQSHRNQIHRGVAARYRDQAWDFLDEETYTTERVRLLDELQKIDRKVSKARLALALEEVAAQLERRRSRLRGQITTRLGAAPGAGGAAAAPEAEGPAGQLEPAARAGGYAGRLLTVRPQTTVVALMAAWWRVLVDEASRLRTEADFEVRQVADLGVQDGRRALRYAVVLSPDTTRPARDVSIEVRSCEPREVRARVEGALPMDLEIGRELTLLVDLPAHLSEGGLRFRVELELRHDDGKLTELVLDGQLSRESRPRARSLFDGFGEQLPTLFAARVKQLGELLDPQGASVGLVTAFAAHGHELLAEAVGLEWPDRPTDSFGAWRMVNLAARHAPTSPGLAPASAASPTMRDVIQQVGARLGAVLAEGAMDRVDTVEALLRAVQDAPVSTSAEGEPRGLLILGLAELAERSRLGEAEQRQLLALGGQICAAYRGRSLVLLSPQAAALALGEAAALPPAARGAPAGEARGIQLLDLDHVADPLAQGRGEERARGELELALGALLSVGPTHGAHGGLGGHGGPGQGAASAPLHAAVHALMDVTGTDLRLIAECLPVVEEALRQRAPRAPGVSAVEGRVANYLQPVWDGLPLPHRLYLAALCADTAELDVGDLRPGMIIDGAVHSISGKDRLPTGKVVAPAGTRLDQRAVEDLAKVMWLKKVRVRGSLGDTRSVLWTYLRQALTSRAADGRPAFVREGRRGAGEGPAADLRRLGLVRTVRLGGDRHFTAFTSPAVREWLRSMLGLGEGEAGLPATSEGRSLVRQLPLWDAAAVDRSLGGNAASLKAVLGWSRSPTSPGSMRWPDFLELARACRKWIEGQDEPRFIEAVARYFRLDLIEGTYRDDAGDGAAPMRSVQIRFRDQRQLPWLKRVVLFLPSQQPDRQTLDEVQADLRARLPALGNSGASGPHFVARPDSAYSGAEWTVSDTALSAIIIVPELTADIVAWSRNLFHVAVIEVGDLQHAALHESPVEELIRRLAAAASYAALSPFRSKMGLANQELIEEMFYGRRALLEEIRGQRQENFLIVGPRKIGKTSLLQRVRFELEQQGYRVIPRGMDYTTAPDSKHLLGEMIRELGEDLGDLPPMGGSSRLALRQVVDLWSQRHPDQSVAIVLDEIDTILRAERRAYLLGEWREAWALGEALSGLLPQGRWPLPKDALAEVRASLARAGFTRDVIEGMTEGLQTEPRRRRPPPLIEELRSASALVLRGRAVCRVILAGHAELAEARTDLFGPLLNFAKLRFLGPLEESSAERMVREPFLRLGLRFENAAAEQLLVQQTFRIPAWIQHCGALIIQSIDERLRGSRREEQKITERDVNQALEKVFAEERAALQSDSGLYMLGPECSFVLFALAEEGWFHTDFAVEFLRFWYESLEPQHRTAITSREREYAEAYSPEAVRRIIRDLTNTFYLISDEVAAQVPAAAQAAGTVGAGPKEATRERLRRTYRVSTPIVRAVFRDEINVQKLVDLARRGVRLYREGRGVWARISNKPLQ